MARTLDVYLWRKLAGHLVQDSHGQMSFRYAESWLADPGAMPLSQSLPLSPERFGSRQCRGFFGGILPEAGPREVVARNLGITSRNDFALLAEIGGECAGAATFLPKGEPFPPDAHDHHILTADELEKILRELPRRPLLAGEDGIRLSLAGAQNKLPVCVSQGQISVPKGGAPSTHILKPSIAHLNDVVFNEAFCMKLAKEAGLNTAPVELGRAGEVDYLLVERYDRKAKEDEIERLHQEDFCQALGIASEQKYQNEGGPSLKQSFDLLRAASSIPVLDLRALLDAVLFNFLIGNHDAHGKNFSLLYTVQTRLAPLYDLVCTVYYPELTKKMAMKIGSRYESEDVLPRHFDAFAEEVGMTRLVREHLRDMAEALPEKARGLNPSRPVEERIVEIIQARCERTLTRLEKSKI